MNFRAFLRDLLCPLILFYIPAYFASQAKEVLSECEASHIVSVYSESEDEEPISPIAFPSPAYTAPWRRALSHDEILTVSTPLTSQPIQRFRSIALESGWTTCVNYWCKLWRIIASVAFTILVGSSALLQMSGTNGDPLIYCLLFLFILCLVAALLSSGILLYYFGKKHFCSEAFAMMWYQKVKRYNQSCFHMPWTIVAVPSIAISWGTIFMLAAVFLSVWGDGLYSNPSSVAEVSPLTILSLRVIITAMSVVDVGWILWLVVKLRAFDKAVETAQSSAA